MLDAVFEFKLPGVGVTESPSFKYYYFLIWQWNS